MAEVSARLARSLAQVEAEATDEVAKRFERH